ncbi:oxidoreductase [Paracoccus denitrificans]|uniref:NADH:flavin oxidoreductase/NADH oxidase n=1 Tax=Paracoccus denitrificans (strain Pd 1222) TaxID=318586 RepID=A1BBW7_PARDP|nr:NADH:flavin oxidoreductase [Paracoccus denitrificans]ABL73011.1 NADH:flavin oxidoreductase/NADH oxidase [Paracoccus denitrificans PD1222]MBB4628387.1 2,4-dienoyl-CoA reductase-like NADH-dependent reductase (Old Yellow Enzyme family) [Paracoccus denitrificans]MCU7429599.1 NADH:flavin oxidoreductase [Paracoccus denitrificans]UPV98267.1 NADH:flavin oxidoreductase [Paracoccus denitrificans]WQO36955.1 NADH:flavin oxidoreductase [Paracoccus denitrificans]
MSGTEVRRQPSASDPLLQPFRLKHLVLRNRVISTSHASMLDAGGLPLERYQRYHEEKARGGLAMTMIGGSAMTSSDSSWGGGQLDLTSDRIIPHLQQLSERIHGRGAAVMGQLSHLGRRATAFGGNWLPVLAPSRVRESRGRAFPKEMDAADIARIIGDYAQAARRYFAGGMDGIETLTGGHLIGQFLSPRTNKRTDAFGGSLENRARFGLMVHEAIRKAVGDKAIVGIRFVIDEGVEDGLGFDDAVALAQLFEREGHVDFFNCIYGRMDNDLVLSEHNMPGLFQRSAPFLPQVAAFRREVRLPVMHAAGIRDVATARHALRENIVDLVGMTRAHIADPDLVNKIVRGEEARIRPCVGASYCLYKKVNCIHNPASGRETMLSHRIDKAPARKKVVVIGGGPGGLEAARICAERGHRVTLFEAAPRLGGQVLVAAAAPERRDLLGIVQWREAELARLGVELRMNTYADAAAVLAEGPDVVIAATGGVPDMDWLRGGGLCDTVWDILTGAAAPREDVLIYDGTGRAAALSCALDLARKGKSVTIATPDEALALEMPYQDRTGFRKRVSELGIGVMVEARLVGVERRGDRLLAQFRHELTDRACEIGAAQVVIESGTIPVDDLYHELRDRAANLGVTDIADMIAADDRPDMTGPAGNGPVLHRIGDSVASRDIHSAIYDAYRICVRI